jgi:hypothetical protein
MIAGAWAGPDGFAAAAQPPVDASRLVLVPPGQVPPGARIVGLVVETAARPAAPHRLGVVGEGTADRLEVLLDRPVPPQRLPEGPNWQSVRSGLLLDREGRIVLLDGVVVRFTRREFDLFEYVAARPGRVLTRAQLLRVVWGLAEPQFAGPRTVDVHVVRLRRKLGRHAPGLETVRGVGYRWVP